MSTPCHSSTFPGESRQPDLHGPAFGGHSLTTWCRRYVRHPEFRLTRQLRLLLRAGEKAVVAPTPCLAEPRLLLGDEAGEVGLPHQGRDLLRTEFQITGDGRELVGRQFGYHRLDLLRDLADAVGSRGVRRPLVSPPRRPGCLLCDCAWALDPNGDLRAGLGGRRPRSGSGGGVPSLGLGSGSER